MEKDVVTAALAGAVLGGMIGFASKIIKKHKQEVNNLGHDWQCVKADPQLTASIYNIKSFRHADEESYYKIGQACDRLVSLWFDVNNPQVEPQDHWAYKSFEYRTTVEKQLQELAKKVDKCKRPARMRTRKADKNGIFDQLGQQKEEEKNTNMDLFREYADELCGIVQNYDYNIRMGVRPRLTGPGYLHDYLDQ